MSSSSARRSSLRRLVVLAVAAVVIAAGGVAWYALSGRGHEQARAAYEQYAALRTESVAQRELAENCSREAAKVKAGAPDVKPDEAARKVEELRLEEDGHRQRSALLESQAAELERRWAKVWVRLGYPYPVPPGQPF